VLENEGAAYSFQVKARDPSQQKIIAKTLQSLRTAFPEIDTHIRVLSEKLTPYEVVLLIAIDVGASVASVILLKFLDRLWDALTSAEIRPSLPSLDSAQMAAEEYLRHLGVAHCHLFQKQDKGLYVFFIFKEETGASHLIRITKSDKQVIQYKRK